MNNLNSSIATQFRNDFFGDNTIFIVPQVSNCALNLTLNCYSATELFDFKSK